jgi:hypothetical protein
MRTCSDQQRNANPPADLLSDNTESQRRQNLCYLPASAANSHVETLQWWCTRLADAFDKHDVQGVQVAFRTLPKSDNSRWHQAIEGDAAAALGVAIKVFRLRLVGIYISAAFAAVLGCALADDWAAHICFRPRCVARNSALRQLDILGLVADRRSHASAHSISDLFPTSISLAALLSAG